MLLPHFTRIAVVGKTGIYQIVLRELQTLSGHSNRLHVWTRAAIEMAAQYA